jgi:hypothetical protein
MPGEAGDAAGMELFYSAESIRLALDQDAATDGSRWPGLDPAAHISRARRETRASVARLLLAAYRGLPSEAARAGTLRVLDGWYCGAAGPAADPRADLEESVAEVFRWTSMERDPRGTGPLRLWFTAESVLLAARGGYANPARNSADPRGHRDWTASVPSRSLIRDLADKTREQFQRAAGAGEADAVRFSAEVMARYASWGGTAPGGGPRSAAPDQWREASRSWFRQDQGELWCRVDGMLRDTAWRLLSRGRRLQDGNCW